MKQMKAVFRISLVLLTAVLLLHVTGLQAFAAEKAEWRGTYDLAMKWVNFFILVFVVVKFGKGPIMRFLRAQKDDVADEIARLDREKQEMIAKIQDAQATLAESDIRFAELKERIVRDGERKKQEIIAQAQQQSELMMSSAEQKVASQILQAQRNFREELIDMAVELASSRLPLEMTEDDDQRMVDLYLASSASGK